MLCQVLTARCTYVQKQGSPDTLRIRIPDQKMGKAYVISDIGSVSLFSQRYVNLGTPPFQPQGDVKNNPTEVRESIFRSTCDYGSDWLALRPLYKYLSTLMHPKRSSRLVRPQNTV